MRTFGGQLALLLLGLAGCQSWSWTDGARLSPSAGGTLADQQLSAYPVLGENAYLVLTDFETADQLDDYALSSSGGSSGIFYSGSPTATGTGALGVRLAEPGAHTVTFSTPIGRWRSYNLFIAAIFPDLDARGVIEIVDAAGRSDRQSFALRQRAWNRLEMDLIRLADRIDLNRVRQVRFHFDAPGPMRLAMDDLILVDYRKSLGGDPDGAAGTLYVAEDGRRTRVGCNGRFELVFYRNRLAGWYDLSTDRQRMNNLLAPDSPGIILAAGSDSLSHDSLVPRSEDPGGRTTVRIEGYGATVTTEPSGGSEDGRSTTYRIYPDGLILISLDTEVRAERLTVGFAVDRSQGFDAVVGKIRNPSGQPAGSRIEYVLFRRMGRRAGSDLLMAVKPWERPGAGVGCRLTSDASHRALRVSFARDASVGVNRVQLMLRVWPPDIDHLGNAENHVRKFIETNWPDLKAPTGSDTWAPTWDIE